MAYYNRKSQLALTLETILQSNYIKQNNLKQNIEIIIVDDASDTNERLEHFITLEPFNKLPIKLIRIDLADKNHVNPCYAYNTALQYVNKESKIVIIQNPEVCHVGDILSYVSEKLQPNDYMTFKCYGSANVDENESIKQLIMMKQNNELQSNERTKTSEIELMNELKRKNGRIGGNSLYSNQVGGWLNNEKHSVCYHYLMAIHYDDLKRHLNGGFDWEYSDGLCHDDDDFVRRAQAAKLRFVMPRSVFGIHLWHPKPKQLSDNKRQKKWQHNNEIFKRKMQNINMPSTFPYFIKVLEID